MCEEVNDETVALLNLLADIRVACGDNGKRMQAELVEYIRELKRDADLFNGCYKNIDQVRKEFEAWHLKEYNIKPQRCISGCYSGRAKGRWQGWLAAYYNLGMVIPF